MIFNKKGSGKKSLFKKILTTITAIFLGILLLGIYESSKEKSNDNELANKEVNVNKGTVDVTKKNVDKPKEMKSEYTERDKPWGEFNYKNVGII